MNPVQFLKDPKVNVLPEVKTEELLRKIVIFQELSSKSLELIEQRVQTLSFQRGEQVILENETAKGVYFVVSGAVKLTKKDENGNDIIVCIKQKGDVFAEACLFSKSSELYPATAAMLEDGQLLFLDKVELEKGLSEYPDLSIQMIRYMSESLRDMTATFRDVALLDVYAKTVKMLERLGNKFNDSHTRWDIEIPLTIQEFSAAVGTTRESVSRVFSKLKKDNIIELKSRKIVILDWCRLCGLLNKNY